MELKQYVTEIVVIETVCCSELELKGYVTEIVDIETVCCSEWN